MARHNLEGETAGTGMFDFEAVRSDQEVPVEFTTYSALRSTETFLICKRGFDVALATCLLPILLTTAAVLIVLNPLLNRGPLFFAQIRMGRDCKPFVAYKFRTMRTARHVTRRPHDPPEAHRITRLGLFLRQTRIDEIPQIINVLKGDMSLIGPRPDYFHHARHYVRTVPGYRTRHTVKPGISGLAQTEVGYAHEAETVANKVRADIYYINNAGFRLEMWIFWRTVLVVFRFEGT